MFLLAPLLGILLLLSPQCGASFMLPEPQSSSLIRGVRVRCEGGGGGGGGGEEDCQRAMNVSLCLALNVCELSCPTRTDFPATELPLVPSANWTLSASIGSAGCRITTDEVPEGGPSSAESSHGLMALNSSASDCVVSSNTPAATTAGRLALALWIRHNCSSNCTVARFGGNDVRVLLHGGKLCVNAFCSTDDLENWTHLVLMISGNALRYAVNGTLNPPGALTIAVSSPSGSLNVSLGVSLAANLQAGDGYELFDVRYYNDVLTVREIQQIYTNGSFGNAGTLNECRCPFSHLTLTSDDPYTCQNKTGDKVTRVNVTFHPSSTLVDGNVSSAWAGPDSGQFVMTVELEDEYQVEKVEVGLKSTVSGSLVMVLPNTDIKQMACNNLVCSMDLSLGSQNVSPQMLASSVMQEFNLTYSDTNHAPGPPLAFSYVNVTGRCNCNGNAISCNMSASPYVCDCANSTNTQEDRCQKCHSNRFRQLAQFDCQGTCVCEMSGVQNPQQKCDQNGGACQCKLNVQGQRCDSCKEWAYGLNASRPLGCEVCACHPNGSVSCDNRTGLCTCRDDVSQPTCAQCRTGFYDVGPLQGPDDCQSCGCDSKGVLHGQICDNVTGQCHCKEYMQGRTCSDCKDGYYNLQVTQPGGCLSCQCNSVGSRSQLCHKDTGQCPCQGNGTTADRLCSPQITFVDPRFGPMIGGTLVTISGQLLGNSSQPPSVFLGSFRQNVKAHNLTTVVVETLNHSQTGNVTVKMSWQSQPSDLTSGHFTYLQDPDLNTNSIPDVAMFVSGQFTYLQNPDLNTNSIPDVAMFVSGGCGVLFKGSNFRSVKFPRISVTDQSSGFKAYSSCRDVQRDLQCITPDLNGMPNMGTRGLSFGLVLDGLRFTNLGPVQVLQDPQLNSLDSHDFQYPFETSITISGSGLKGGCSQSEVSVLIGVVNCDIVSFTETEIECEPPKALKGSKDKPIVVKMGSHISKQVGTLNYLELYETSYFIGIASGVGALILLILILIVVCCCCRGRCRRGGSQRESHQMSFIVKSETNGSAAPSAQPNQYSELPQSGATGFTNRGFQSPTQQETVLREPRKDAPAPSASDVDVMSEFLNRVERSLWDSIRSATVSSSDLKRGNICTNSGKFARIIDGQFSTERGGQRHEIKVTIKTIKEKLPEEKGLVPMWATAALRECLRLHRRGGDNVLSVLGVALDTDRYHIVYPRMHNRTLKDHIIDSSKEFSVRQLVEYGLQVADGLAFLSAKDLVHKDLAARNCWVDSECVVKIADASFSWDFYGDEYVYDSARERHMPLRWMAPESLTDGYYDMRTDVWSLGVLLWELLTRGCLPFHEVEDGRVKDYILEGYLLGKPENCSDNLYEVMKECWNLENEHRPHITSVVKLLGEELTGDGVEQDDIYVNLGTSDSYYENQNEVNKARRKAPLPPS
ncbi:hypothetical protein ACOMHN_041683 [Nucella lapillus]